MTISPALSGIRILDFSRVVAAPFASMILGDLGAEVWKIERPGVGDDSRLFTPPEINGQSCYTLGLNRNKKSIAMNLAHPEAQNLAQKLATKADIVIENFKTGYMKNFCLDYPQLAQLNPGLIYCSITGYGPEGPCANDPGYDVIAAAVGGFLGITGLKSGDQEPVKAGVAVTDLATGLYAHGAILAALFHRIKTGKGQHINCNLFSTQLAMLTNIASNFLNAGIEGRPLGTEHESIVPYQAFRTKDNRFFVVGAGNDQAFKKLCDKMDLQELCHSSDYKTNADRVQNREKLIGIFSKKFLEHDLEHWKKLLKHSNFPAGPVNTIREAFCHEQTQHIGIVKPITHQQYGTVKVVGPPVLFSMSENRIRSPPPVLGEHTKEILRDELGLDEGTLERLKREKAIDY
ncbi:hypothetical protein niasHT_002516 [Heterodera trifolii]|uniref:Uncharacterized protein n=1 Tax=Heterodera trifolii TaxID=157864 RepID=A0ABD2LWI5_9BILA